MMMAGDWTIPHDGPRDAGDGRRASAPARAPEGSYGDAVSMAFRPPPAVVPEDLLGLLARLK